MLSRFEAPWLTEKAAVITRMRTPGLVGRLLRSSRIFTGPRGFASRPARWLQQCQRSCCSRSSASASSRDGRTPSASANLPSTSTVKLVCPCSTRITPRVLMPTSSASAPWVIPSSRRSAEMLWPRFMRRSSWRCSCAALRCAGDWGMSTIVPYGLRRSNTPDVGRASRSRCVPYRVTVLSHLWHGNRGPLTDRASRSRPRTPWIRSAASPGGQCHEKIKILHDHPLLRENSMSRAHFPRALAIAAVAVCTAATISACQTGANAE